MLEELQPEEAWQRLLDSGGYSIGYFSVTVDRDTVRVFHYRTKQEAYFDKQHSFEGMQQLCAKRGYDFRYLLKHYIPKSFREIEYHA